MKLASVAPRAPAIAWFRNVATKMPRMIVQGLRKRAARKTASNIVLSPISAAATTPVESAMVCRISSIRGLNGVAAVGKACSARTFLPHAVLYKQIMQKAAPQVLPMPVPKPFDSGRPYLLV